MLSLDSPRWAELRHAYGSASDIPDLLRQLDGVPASSGESEPWVSIWSALAHQGDVYGASFAAVPYVVQALATAPLEADHAYFNFPAWVEVCRRKQAIEVPADLSEDYFAALARLPTLVGAAAARSWDSSLLLCALSAIAAAKGDTVVAEAVCELTPEVAAEFMQWLVER